MLIQSNQLTFMFWWRIESVPLWYLARKFRHRKRVVKSDKMVKERQCALCGKSSKQSKLARHMLSHTTERLHKCAHCKKSYKGADALKNHIIIHNGEKQFTCTMCSKSFWYRTSLTEHKRTHNDEKQHSCAECEVAFHTYGNLKAHVLTHSGR